MTRVTVLVVIVCMLGLSNQIVSGRKSRRCLDNTLDRQEFLQYVATEETFLHIYSVEKSETETFGKSYTSITPVADGRFDLVNYAFNEVQEECQLFPDLNTTIVDRKKRRSKRCCKKGQSRIDSFITLEGEVIQYRWFSQAPEKYFWMFFCNNGTVRTFDSCMVGYVDLQIRDTRPRMTGEINLNGLPWHLIAEDIKFTGIKFEDIKYIWRGPPCSLDDFPDRKR